VIAYFDTSAIVPLMIDEPASTMCERLWDESDRIVSVRLLYPEARAALARARRMQRITSAELTAAVDELDVIATQVDHIEVADELAHTAGELAQTHGLRGYDAVHLAAATAVAQGDFVLVTGDSALSTAARSLGISVALIGWVGDGYKRSTGTPKRAWVTALERNSNW
jgi:uncharacterized protein